MGELPNPGGPVLSPQARAALRRRQQDEAWRDSADPVVIVGIELPLSAVFALWVQVTIINVLVGAVVVAVLFLVGVL